MKMIMVTAIVCCTTCMPGLSQTADSATKTSPVVIITGSADFYYRYNFNNPKSFPFNSPTSFTHSSNSFELGMASLRADHSFGKAAITADLGFGKRAEEFAYNDSNTRLTIKQLFITYLPAAAVKLTIGTWATHIGYEFLDAYLNRNYSLSYMFTNGPFSHTGLKADISLGGKKNLMVGISNPTDYRTAPAMPKSVIAQLATASKNDKLKVYLNFLGGKQNDLKKLMQGDIVFAYAVSSIFGLGYNGTVQSLRVKNILSDPWSKAVWWGFALYATVDPVSYFGLALRVEYIGDKDQYLGLQNAIVPTVSANFKIDKLTIIPEFRFDHTGNAVFYKTSAETTNSTTSFILAATYYF